MTRARVALALFAVGCLGAGWLGVALDRAQGVDLTAGVAFSRSSGTSGQGVFLVLPALVAITLFLAIRDGAGPLGFTIRFPDRGRWLLGSVVLFPVVAALTVGAGVALGAVTWSTSPSAGKPSLIAAFLVVTAIQVPKNLLEEFAFRGYGTRTAMAAGLPGRATPHLVVGLIWALWHLPLYLVWTSPSDLRMITSATGPAFLALLVVGVVATALVYGELRVRTGSLWPPVVLHTMANAVATPLLVNGHLHFRGHADILFAPAPTAVVTMLLFGLAGMVLIRSRTSAPRTA